VVTYSFPVQPGSLAAGYRIQASPSPNPVTLGFARAGSFGPDSFRFNPFLSFLVVDWNNTLNQSFGGVVRVSSPGLGTMGGYALTYSTSGSLNLSRIDNEVFSVLASTPLTLDPQQDYRFVLLGGPGGGVRGEVFDHTSGFLIADIGAIDRTYAGGISGFYVASGSPNGSADATFDFYELGIVPEPSVFALMFAGGGLLVGWKVWQRRRDAAKYQNSTNSNAL